MRNLIRLRKTGGLVSLGLLVVNQALLVAQIVAWRGFDPWLIVPTVALGLFALAIFASWAIWVLGDGYHHETAAQVSHSPVQVYAPNPWQIVLWRTFRLPKARALASIAEGEAREELQEAIERWERWIELGYIPRDEYPPDLLHHYLASEGQPI
jgi:hypothetical protein